MTFSLDQRAELLTDALVSSLYCLFFLSKFKVFSLLEDIFVFSNRTELEELCTLEEKY